MALPLYYITSLDWWVISGMEAMKAACKPLWQCGPGHPSRSLPGHRLGLGSPETMLGTCRGSTLWGDRQHCRNRSVPHQTRDHLPLVTLNTNSKDVKRFFLAAQLFPAKKSQEIALLATFNIDLLVKFDVKHFLMEKCLLTKVLFPIFHQFQWNLTII